MSVRVAEDAVVLEGRCLVEDAEALLVALQEHSGLPVDVTGVERLHMAVVQVLFVLRPDLRGTVRDPFLARHILGGPDFR